MTIQAKPSAIFDYVDIYLCALETVYMKKRVFENRSLTFKCRRGYEAGRMPIVRGNFSQFCRMASNLMDNAAEAIDENRSGTVDVFVDVKPCVIEFRVKDDGIGMPQDQRL